MRHVVSNAVLATGFLALVAGACGPDPNARLPGSPTPEKTGGNTSMGGSGEGGVGAGGETSRGGSSGNGGNTVVSPGSGGAAGSSPFDTGGAGGTKTSASGGAAGSSPFGNGGVGAGGTTGKGGSGSGGITPAQGGAGGASAGGNTGSGGKGGGTGTSSTWGVGAEPCSPAKDLSCASGTGSTGNFESSTAFCFRTADIIAGWSCNNLEGWTMTINGQPVTCTSGTVSSATMPPSLNGIYYFAFTGSDSAKTWASLSWYANTGNCKAGPYPAWGGSSTTPTPDAGSTAAGIDSGS